MEQVKKVERRGGARANSGPKPQTLSANQVLKMLRKARRWAKKHGKDIDDILLGMIYGLGVKDETVEVSNNEKIACIKLWKEYTVAKLAEGGEADRVLGPSVFLPEQRPVLKGVEGGKAA